MQSKSGDFPNIVGLLLSYWKLLVLAIILGAIIGVSLMPKRAPVWAASGLIRIGQINGSILTDAATIESIALQPSFTRNALEKASMSSDLRDPASLLALSTLTTQAQRTPSLVGLRVSAYSPEDAKRILEGAVATLQQQTEAAFDDEIQQRKRKLAGAEKQLAENLSERDTVLAALKSGQVAPATDVMDSLVVSYLLRVTQADSDRLRLLIDTLQDQMNPIRTFNTRLEAPISVTPVPQGGSKIVSGAIGAMAGFIIAFALALIQIAIRTRYPVSRLINRD